MVLVKQNRRSAKNEIGRIPIANYTHKIPKTFYCVQCGKKHSTTENWHYYNPLCHKWGFK